MKKPFILFDFDGVITDSFQTAFEVQKMICPHITEDIYRKLFEGNINDSWSSVGIHTNECRHDIDFFAEYIPRMKNEAQIVPGMRDVIMELEKNYTLIVISSTISSPIREFLEEHDLASHFTQIMGNDIHKSKVEKIKMVFEKYGIEAKDCVFITDTLGDMKEAAQMEVGAIGTMWGFHKTEALLRGNPFCLVDEPAKLPVAISNYFKK